MNTHCLQCGESLDQSWQFCARCGAQIPQPVAIHAEEPPPEPAPVTGAFSGLALGLVAAPIMVIVGGMLCCTGLGAFLGVPMIIAGILAPLAGPLFGMGAARGKVL